MRNLKENLKNRIILIELLEKQGFIKENNIYKYSKIILDNKFIVKIEYQNNNLTSKLIEIEFNDEYLQADSPSIGEYSNNIRKEYERVLDEVIKNISIKDIFKNVQTKKIIKYIKNKYNDSLEFLWEKYDDNAVIRNKINNKWYTLIMKVSEDKLGINSNKKQEVLNILYDKEDIKNIVDNKSIFFGYHMNKKSWITIILDGRLKINKIYKLIDNSYKLSIKKRK